MEKSLKNQTSLLRSSDLVDLQVLFKKKVMLLLIRKINKMAPGDRFIEGVAQTWTVLLRVTYCYLEWEKYLTPSTPTIFDGFYK